METATGFPEDDTSPQDYRARFWSFAWPAPLIVSATGGIMWLVGESDMARAMWLYSVVQGLFLIGYLLRPGSVRLVAALTLYSYVIFSFLVVLLFGGILKSGGVVFVGLAGALFALPFLGQHHFRILSALFIGSVILEVILQHFIAVRAELGDQANRLLFVAHLLTVAMVVFRTISQYVRQNLAAKQRETERLKHLDRLKSDFYMGVTHEFRTPLTVILGMAEQIRRAPKQYAGTGAELIRESGTRLLHLINQMLDLGKLEAGHMDLHLIQGDINPYLEYLVEPFHHLAAAKDVRLDLCLMPGKRVMDYDPEKTASLVTNLLSNALKHAPAGSDVQVKLGVVGQLPEPGDSTYSLFTPGKVPTAEHYLQIEVRDEGRGIARELMPRIFERFQQVEAPFATRTEGSGIGLAIVRELLTLLGGQLHLESRIGQGSRFTIFLPIRRQAPPAEGPCHDPAKATRDVEAEIGVSEPGQAARKRHRILLIEDNAGVLAYLQTVLGNDFLLESATDGAEGIARAMEAIPDLVITDIMMPKRDGFAVCETLKQDIRTSHIPIIMLTARADAASKLEGLAHGADDYLVKPFDPDELTARIKNLLHTRELLRHRYQLHGDRQPEVTPPHLDDQFIGQIKTVLLRQLDDEQFDTEGLARAMHMSRTQLFRKLKALTGHSASEIIRHFRMEKAKDLVLRTDQQISEIAYAVGFKDPAYFSKVFARSYGQAPSEFRHRRDATS